MPAPTTPSSLSPIELATGIVAAFVSNNPVPAAELPALIVQVHSAITHLVSGTITAETGTAAQPGIDRPTSAEIRNSVQHDKIVSFIDGNAYKTLKRHLTAHGLHPQAYRDRYGLPADYPMVAGEYAERRSTLAKQIGLGKLGATVERDRKDRKAA